MMTNEALQSLLYDFFCLWHDVRRHYDPPRTDTEAEKQSKIRSMVCKIVDEIDYRAHELMSSASHLSTEMLKLEEWAMLTWNLLCITSRMQTNYLSLLTDSEGKQLFAKINATLRKLVDGGSFVGYLFNLAHEQNNTPFSNLLNQMSALFNNFYTFSYKFAKDRYHMPYWDPATTEEFLRYLGTFSSSQLSPFLDALKSYGTSYSLHLWGSVRGAQIAHMVGERQDIDEAVVQLVSYYSHMVYMLAMLASRLQTFRYDLITNRVFNGFENFDPIMDLLSPVFQALELVMADCVLCTHPTSNAILVTNNLFTLHCGALARGVVFKQFDVQVVSEEGADYVQSEMKRQKILQRSAEIKNASSAALLAMKPATGTKRTNSNNEASNSKKVDCNSKEVVTIYPIFHGKNRYWAASYPHLLCTTRQRSRQSHHSSYQDLLSDKGYGKRPIFYFHIRATLFSPSGGFSDAHTLSVPFTIATRRNQDCQVQKMMSSYTATCFWLYGHNKQNGLLLNWVDAPMTWEQFKHLFKRHFQVNTGVNRGLHDRDFDLLQYKLKCNDCKDSESGPLARMVSFKNMLCPHLRYECGSYNNRFSVWRGLLELLQIFMDTKNDVRTLWEQNIVMGFMEFDQVSHLLNKFESALVMRLSFVTGGTICFTIKSNSHQQEGISAPMHLEPLDLKKLQAKSLTEYLRDIAIAEKVDYVINHRFEPVHISSFIKGLTHENGSNELETSRKIASNVTHSGDIDNMQHITFTTLRIAVVTCKVKQPGSEPEQQENRKNSTTVSPYSSSIGSNQTQHNGSNGSVWSYAGGVPRSRANSKNHSDFVRDLMHLCNLYGKTKRDLLDTADQIGINFPDSARVSDTEPTTDQWSPPQNGQVKLGSHPASTDSTPPGSAGYGMPLVAPTDYNSLVSLELHPFETNYLTFPPSNEFQSLSPQHRGH